MLTLDLTETFSDREHDIYGLLCQNLNNSDIARELGLTIYTVQYHLKSIYRKLGLQSCNKKSLHAARRKAITYSGTKIEEVYHNEKMTRYTADDIWNACDKLTWHDKARLGEIVGDLLAVLSGEL